MLSAGFDSTMRRAVAAAVRTEDGLVKVPVALTGPQLLMLCDDMATALRPNAQGNRPPRDGD